MKEKQKTHVNRKNEKGEIMSPGRWEYFQGDVGEWAFSARRPEMRCRRLAYVVLCHFGPDEDGRPAFGGKINQLTMAEFSRKYGVSKVTLSSWRKEIRAICDGLAKEYLDQQENKQTEAEDVQAELEPAKAEPEVNEAGAPDDDIPF